MSGAVPSINYIGRQLGVSYIGRQCTEKLSSAIFALKSVKKILPLNMRKIVYESLIKSQLEFGILAWGFG